MIQAIRRLLDVIERRNAVVRSLAAGVLDVAGDLEAGRATGTDAAAVLRALCAAAFAGLKEPQ